MRTQFFFLWRHYSRTDTETPNDRTAKDKPSRDLRSGMMPIILPDEHSHFCGWAPPDHVLGLHIPHGSVTRE